MPPKKDAKKKATGEAAASSSSSSGGETIGSTLPPSSGSHAHGHSHAHDDGDDDGHERFEEAYQAFAYVQMCLDRGYTMSNAVRLAPAMGVDPAMVPMIYKRLLGARLREAQQQAGGGASSGVGGANVVTMGGAAKSRQPVALTPSQSALEAAMKEYQADPAAGLAALKAAADGGLTLGAYLQRMAPALAIATDDVKGRKLVAAHAFEPGSVILKDLSVLHGAAGVLAAGRHAYAAAASGGQLDFGAHMEGEAAGAAGGSAAKAALVLTLQLNNGPLSPGYTPPPPSSSDHTSNDSTSTSIPSLGDHLHAVFGDNQFQGCAFLPKPEGQSAAQEAEAGGHESRRLTAIFPALSLVNHSCTPNSRFQFKFVPASRAVEAQVIAEAPIAPGDEITFAYCDIAVTQPERRARLQDTFGFVCTCARCANPEDDAIALKCPGCKTGVLHGGATSCAGCGADMPPAKMRALLGLREKMLADHNREALVARISGDAGKLQRQLASLCRVMHDSDTHVFSALRQLLEVATGPAARQMAAAIAAARAAGKKGFEDKAPLTPAELYALARRAEAALGAMAPLHSPLTAAALHDEIAHYYCSAGPEAAPDVKERAAAAFTAAAEGISRYEPSMGVYAAHLRTLADAPPLGPEEASAAREAAMALIAQERDYLG